MAAIVLIHGAYQGGWIWQRVVRRLTADGHTVFAPSLDGCAERRHALRPGITTETHGAEIAELLFFEDLHDVVLVGTSSGGMVVCSAAEQARERIGRLVFADALALFDGESIPDIVKRPTAVTTDLTTGPSREDAAGRMFASLDDATKAWALERYTPHPVAAMRDPVKLPELLAAEMAGDGDLVQPGGEPGRRPTSAAPPIGLARRGTSWIPATIPW